MVTPPEPDSSGCVAIVVANEQYHEDAQGLTSNVKFRERMLRCADRVWTERIRPSWALPERRDEAHHHLPNPDQMARLVSKENGELRLDLVDSSDQQIIHIPPSEFASVGFNADVETAFNLISKRNMDIMRPATGRTAAKNSRWMELVSERGYNRVHWSDALGLPLEIEIGSHDGRERDHIVVTFEKVPSPAEMPWNKITGYQRREYEDFLD